MSATKSPNSSIVHAANFLKVNPGKADLTPHAASCNVSSKSFYTVVRKLLEDSKALNTNYNDTLFDIKLRQWLEYIQIYLAATEKNANAVSQIMGELNQALQNNTYILGHKLTVVDVLLYFHLHHIMVNIQYDLAG